MSEDQEVKIARLEEQSKTMFSRVASIEEAVKVIPEMNTQLQLIARELCSTVKDLSETVDKQDKKIEALEKKPSDYWDKVITTIISTAVAAIVSSFMYMIMNGVV